MRDGLVVLAAIAAIVWAAWGLLDGAYDNGTRAGFVSGASAVLLPARFGEHITPAWLDSVYRAEFGGKLGLVP